MIRIEYPEAETDGRFRKFTSSLAPDAKLPFIGIPVPVLKEKAKALPYDRVEIRCVEDVMIENFIIAYAKHPFTERVELVNYILPYYSSWIMTDTLACNLKLKKSDMAEAFRYSVRLAKSEEEYVKRTGITILLARFLTPEWIDSTLEVFKTAAIGESRRPVTMAIAWGLCTALIKDYDKTLSIWSSFSPEIRKMAAQKCRDSKRLSPENKTIITKLS
jgi:DNA alkylation repair enzyme.